MMDVLVCTPRAAGWDDPARAASWQEIGFLHRPDCRLAEEQHRRMVHRLEECGCTVHFLPADGALTLDAVYVHDASLPSVRGAVLLRMGKESRAGEPPAHGRWYDRAGIPVLGEIRPPGTVEAGDALWLGERTLLVGRGYRTNEDGIAQLRAILAPSGVAVIPAPLPHASGPRGCLHLMSLISRLDDRTFLVDLPRLAVETVEALDRFGCTLIEIDYEERDSLACNVLALGGGRLLALEENGRTNGKLRAAGFDVRTFPGSEIGINGGGGPTCLTRPLPSGGAGAARPPFPVTGA